MCGISGIYAFDEQGKQWHDNLQKATDAIQSRGPDSQACFFDQHVGLGHRRLSILDTSAAGNQPMTDPSGRYTLIFNGEIYNYRELKPQLDTLGVPFRSTTDTEVILQLYIHKGVAFLDELNGFFTIAIYDKVEGSLLIARDRMGIKPLVFHQDEHSLVFASELKALLAFPFIKRELDYEALYQYLQFNYISAPATIFRGIHKLMPGHYMMLKGKEVETKQYYQVPYDESAARQQSMTYEQQQAHLLELLDDSVQKRLVSDVPLGAFLSGGIDSSTIVALASRHTQQLNTFSIGFRDQAYFDETHYAEMVAKQYKTNHTSFSLTNDELYGTFHEVLDYLDEPFADSSALLVHILSKRTREHVTVALSGDGADELFAGYHKYYGELRARQQGIKAGAVKLMAPVWQALPKSRNSKIGNKVRQLHRFAEGASLSEKERYWRWCAFVGEEEAAEMLVGINGLDQQRYQARKADVLRHLHPGGSMNEFLYTDVHNVLTNDMLTKVDLMSMANSLEVRVPFLDHRIVEFAFNLPISSKINGQMKKRVLQDAVRPLLPTELYNRPKRGFEVPLLQWFQTELKSVITDDLLADERIADQGIFDPAYVRGLKEKLFSRDPGEVHAQVWGLIVFQHWWKRVMEE